MFWILYMSQLTSKVKVCVYLMEAPIWKSPPEKYFRGIELPGRVLKTIVSYHM